MPLSPCHRGAALLAAVAVVLCFTPAQAQRPALEISSPAPGGVRTVVTGQGAAASVAWPYGPATMKMTLLCEGGQRFGHTQRIPLKVDCKPSTPSQEAVTGLTGSERERPQGAHSVEVLMKLSRATVGVSPTWLSLGKSGTLEFYSLLKRVWAPEIQLLRVVRLDEKGQVAERFQPVPLSGSESSSEFKPRLTFTPKAAGTARFALEAEYADGSRVLTQSAEVQILTPAQEAARKATKSGLSRSLSRGSRADVEGEGVGRTDVRLAETAEQHA